VNLGIGQGEINTTPLQMAAFTATLANGGTYYRPHVVREIKDRVTDHTTLIDNGADRLPISRESMSIIQRGMYRVVNGSGTGYAARVSGARVAGKTGTAQNPPNPDHAWFVGFAPYESPRIAVAVIVENGGFGGTAAAPLAGAIIRRYLFGTTAPQGGKSADDAPQLEIPVASERGTVVED
jgi:penicillin-binding protein 2